VAAPIVDGAAGVGCVAEPEACPAIIAGNTAIQEGLVALQAAATPGYSASDALEAQVPIATGDALDALGGWASDLAGGEEGATGYTGLGRSGKAALSTAVGLPQLILDGSVGKANAAGFNCGP
jgi:hypothetical protein